MAAKGATASRQVLLTLPEAAEACRVSLAHFRRKILPELKVVRIGTSIRIAVAELERWADSSGTLI